MNRRKSRKTRKSQEIEIIGDCTLVLSRENLEDFGKNCGGGRWPGGIEGEWKGEGRIAFHLKSRDGTFEASLSNEKFNSNANSKRKSQYTNYNNGSKNY